MVFKSYIQVTYDYDKKRMTVLVLGTYSYVSVICCYKTLE